MPENTGLKLPRPGPFSTTSQPTTGSASCRRAADTASFSTATATADSAATGHRSSSSSATTKPRRQTACERIVAAADEAGLAEEYPEAERLRSARQAGAWARPCRYPSQWKGSHRVGPAASDRQYRCGLPRGSSALHGLDAGSTRRLGGGALGSLAMGSSQSWGRFSRVRIRRKARNNSKSHISRSPPPSQAVRSPSLTRTAAAAPAL